MAILRNAIDRVRRAASARRTLKGFMMRAMMALPWLIWAMPASAAAPIPKAAQLFVDAFRSLCLANYGDAAAVRVAASAAGYREDKFLPTVPGTLILKNGPRALVYTDMPPRPGLIAGPQCSLQGDRVPGGSLERLAEAIDAIAGSERIETSKGAEGPLFHWHVTTPKGVLQINLSDAMLMGERNVGLYLLPSPPEP